MSPNLRIKLDKRLKISFGQKRRIFLLGGKRERRREGVEREAPTSLYDLRRSGGCIPMGQGLNSKYLARATRGYQKLQVSPRFRVEG